MSGVLLVLPRLRGRWRIAPEGDPSGSLTLGTFPASQGRIS